jgi:ribosomal protein L11 methyltransferase
VIRLALRVRREHAELVLAELLELAPAGLEEVDVDAEVVEYAVYGAPGELPALPRLRAAAGAALINVSSSELPDDWSLRWRAFHRPVFIAPPAGSTGVGALYVRPPWEPPAEPPAHARPGPAIQDIVIDPGQAFGTGAHASTRMCLELLLELAAAGLAAGPLLDVGCGSGVLAIAGARLGWGPVLALDHEAESVQATRDNAVANGVSLDVRRFDLREEPPPAAPTVVANLLRPLLLDLCNAIREPPAQLLASGLLAAEVGEVGAAFQERLGLRERARRSSGEWAAVWLCSER